MANPATQEQELIAGWQALERGDPRAAETIARQLLRRGCAEPLEVIAHNLLGVSLMQQARHEEARGALTRALERDPGAAGTRLNLGSAFVHLGRHAEAVSHFRKAAEIEPRLAQAHFNLGHALKELGKLEEAAAAYRAVLALEPASVLAHLNLGILLRFQGHAEEAAASFSAAIEGDAGCAEAYAQLGMVRRAQGRLPEAIALLEKALSIEGDHFAALMQLGAACQEQGRSAEAATCFGRALALDPRSADAKHNLGIALAGLSRHDEAIACFREALSIDPGRKYTPGALLWSELLCCRWDSVEADTAATREGLRKGVPAIEPFALTAVSEDQEEQRRCAELFYADRVKSRKPVWKGERYRHERIRVAYLSADFREHAVAYCIAELIELHDRSRFEIIGASLGADDGGATRARLVRAFDRFIDLRLPGDVEAARLLRETEVDIVVDLMGYTRGARPGILAHRPSPLQVGYLGHPGTVGAGFLDYILADRLVLPQAQQAFFSEKAVVLPDSYQANDRRREVAPGDRSRKEAGLPESGFVFCCLNNSYKIAPRMFEIWMRVLARTPGSVLWLFEDNAAAGANLRREAQERGVDPGRIVLAPRLPAAEYRARCRLADLCLDTLPYNGHGTTGDMLWCGVPVLTCEGAAFPGRVAASLLHAVGLPELITRDLAEYEATALKLAADKALLASLRDRLARNRDTAALFDTDRLRRHIESAYVTMWNLWQRGEAPRAFAVEQAN